MEVVNNNDDIVFFKVWRNTVIKKLIINHSMYIRNKRKEFDNIQSLREYGEKEYIETLVYTGKGILCKGDLPENGVLKEVDLSNGSDPLQKNSRISSCNIFPHGVEIIHFPWSSNQLDEIKVSELPSSVHTITNVSLKKPLISNEIPTNITSLSFNTYNDPIEFHNKFYDIIIPNSVKKLNLSNLYYRYEELPIAPPSFIPQSVTELSLWYIEEYKLNLPKVPSSVTKLHLDICRYNCKLNQELIPFGVEELSIDGYENEGIINLSAKSLPESLTKLTIKCGVSDTETENNKSRIQPNSIPSTVLDLNINFTNLGYPSSFDGIFPPNLTSLVIDKFGDSLNPPPTLSELPLSLKYLKIEDKEINIKKQ